MTKKITVLASGRGSNFRAVGEAIREGRIPGAQITSLIADRTGTGAAEWARTEGITVHEITFADFADRTAFDAELHRAVRSVSPDLILTLGYMRIIAADLVREYAGRMINIHPSLLPAFPGMRSARQALEYGVRIAGATVHYVDTRVDTGPIIRQAAVPVAEEMTVEQLESRILVEEHRILAEAVALHVADRLFISEDGRRVRTRGETP